MNGLDFGTAIGLIKGLGSPDPAVIESAVSDWLDDHPEATTTVQDGSITKAKLDSNLQGTVDDVADLKSAINQPDYTHLVDLFEDGTATVSNGAVSYSNAANTMRIRRNLSVPLKTGDVVCYRGIAGRIIKVVNGTATQVVNSQKTDFTITEDADYIFTISYNPSATVTDKADLASRLLILRADSKINTMLAEKENEIQAITDTIDKVVLSGTFEFGTAFISGSSINYDNTEHGAVRTKKGTTLSLKAGEIIKADSSVEYRLINKNTMTNVVNYGSKESFTIPTTANYVLVVRYISQATIESIDDILKLVYIIKPDNIVHIYGLDALDGDIYDNADLNDIDYKFLHKEWFSIGRAYLQNGTTLKYDSNNIYYCTKSGIYLQLKKGDRVVPKNGADIRVIRVTDRSTSTIAAEDATDGFIGYEFTLETDGEYVIVVRPEAQTAITELRAELTDMVIVKAGSDVDIVKVDNSAKGVFCVMSYNVGRWWNGSGNIADDSKFETLYNLQSGIINRYEPDILCIQEYDNSLTTNKSAYGLLLLPNYANIAKTKPGTQGSTGKAICTNRTMTDAQNIIYTNNDGQTRNYEKCYIWMNGRKVCVVSTHMTLNGTVKQAQFAELLNAVQSEEYLILCMDSNVDNADTSSTEYQNTIKQFTDAGYKLVNSNGLITHEDDQLALDQIIVTPNINVKSAIVDKQKYGYADGSDHYPLIGYIEVF